MAKVSVSCTGKEGGFIRGQVGIGGASRLVNVAFKIDTGSIFTLLLDSDFLDACQALGLVGHRDLQVLQWIRTQRDIFFEIRDQTYTIAGQTNPIFLINHSYLWFLQGHDDNPPDKWWLQCSVYGTFSEDFLEDEDSPSYVSLLGSDKLRELQRIVWTRHNSTIELER